MATLGERAAKLAAERDTLEIRCGELQAHCSELRSKLALESAEVGRLHAALESSEHRAQSLHAALRGGAPPPLPPSMVGAGGGAGAGQIQYQQPQQAPVYAQQQAQQQQYGGAVQAQQYFPAPAVPPAQRQQYAAQQQQQYAPPSVPLSPTQSYSQQLFPQGVLPAVPQNVPQQQYVQPPPTTNIDPMAAGAGYGGTPSQSQHAAAGFQAAAMSPAPPQASQFLAHLQAQPQGMSAQDASALGGGWCKQCMFACLLACLLVSGAVACLHGVVLGVLACWRGGFRTWLAG